MELRTRNSEPPEWPATRNREPGSSRFVVLGPTPRVVCSCLFVVCGFRPVTKNLEPGTKNFSLGDLELGTKNSELQTPAGALAISSGY